MGGFSASANATVHYDESILSAGSGCCAASSCDDGNPCTVDSCNGDGSCSHAPAANGTACSGTNKCEQTYACQDGVCTGSGPVACTASDACHAAGTCDPSSGACSNPPVADGTGCNDGNACTQTDSCQSGGCVGSNPVTCVAGDSCHLAGSCNPQTGACTNPSAADGTACSDGNACTGSGACDGGACASVMLKFDSLPSAQGWTYSTSGQPESAIFSVDGSTLHQNSMGTGLNGPAAFQYYILNGAVDSTKAFTVEVRARVLQSETAGLGGFGFGVFTDTDIFETWIDTSSVKDALKATLTTTIDTTQFHDYRIEGTPGPSPGYTFFVDGVIVATGLPLHVTSPNQVWLGDGTSDGNAKAEVTFYRFSQCGGSGCGAPDACQGGVCRPGSAAVIDDRNPCTSDSCDPTAGVTHTPVASGTSCSDGNACNGPETCDGNGACQPGTPVVCAAADACHTAGTCDPASGSCSSPAAADGTACGAGVCQGGTCAPAAGPLQLGCVRSTDHQPTSTVVRWTTSRAADSLVEYGVTTSYGASVSNAVLSSDHAVSISGLTQGTVYHYRVTSRDASGSASGSGDQLFWAGDPCQLGLTPFSTTPRSGAGPGRWTTLPSMGTGRSYHASTLLADGSVLAAGGLTTAGVSASAELFSPGATAWLPLPPMSSPRYLHSATPLLDGRVLVAGGYASASVAAADLYDPSRRAWLPASPMSASRNYHAAARLLDGRVLVAGGQDDVGYISTAEIYDPSSNSWSAAPSLAQPRGGGSALTLNDGRVLVVGGRNASGPIQAAELFDPSTGAWTTGAPLAVARFAHTATVLVDGRVLVAGGLGTAGVVQGTEIFDPASGTWSGAGDMSTPRMDHAALRIRDGRVLVFGGGASNDYQVLRTADIFDPATNRWTRAPSETVGRRTFAVVQLGNGDVLASGGTAGSQSQTPAAEVYRPGAAGWLPITPMSQARHDHTTTLMLDGRVMVTGGFGGPGVRQNPVAAAEIFDPATDTWTPIPQMHDARARHRASLLPDGRVLVTGGVIESGGQGPGRATAEAFDTCTNTWTPLPPMAVDRYLHTSTVLCGTGKVIVTGGDSSAGAQAVTERVEAYNPVTNAWESHDSMSTPREHHKAALLADGRVLVSGGAAGSQNFAPNYLNTSELFDPAVGHWAAPVTMNAYRAKHRSLRLADGRVLIAGGFDPNGSPLYSTEVFDVTSGAWTLVAATTGQHIEAELVPFAGASLLLAGGWTTNLTEAFDPPSGTWSARLPMNEVRGEFGLAPVFDGRTLAAGGLDVTQSPQPSAEVYDPADNTVGSLAPTAHDDAFATDPDSPLVVPAPGVLANDATEGATAVTAVLVAAPTSGTLSLDGVGSFRYTPASGFSGTDSFTYRAVNGTLASNVATVVITVAPANPSPPVDGGSPASTDAGSGGGAPAASDAGSGGSAPPAEAGADGAPPPPSTNQPPVVNCGPNVTLPYPQDTTTITCTVTDDGLPAGSTLATSWSGSGPGDFQLSNATATSVTVQFPVRGAYTILLTATDGALTTTAQVVVTAQAANQAPIVDAGPDQTVTFPNIVNLSATVTDDGLPAGAAVTSCWLVLSGPGTVTFGSTCAAATTATFSAPGTYVLQLDANDTALTGSGDVTITVSPPPVNQAPVVSAGPDQTMRLPGTLVLSGTVTDDGLPVGGALTSFWSQASGPAPVSFSNPNGPATTVTFTKAGAYVLQLTANDSALESTGTVNVTVLDTITGPPPTVSIASPAEAAEVTAPTSVVGTVDTPTLDHWTLSYRPLGAPAFTDLATGTTTVAAASLGTLDPTLMLNGIVELQLTAADTSGQTATDSVRVALTRNLKVGNFTVSFKDLSVPVAGIPIEVVRTYDSRNKSQGDFGVGWTLDIDSVRLQKNRAPGDLWQGTVEAGTLITNSYCVRPVRPHVVTVTFSDGKVFRFEAHLSPECQDGAPLDAATLSFAPLTGTDATLSVDGSSDVVISASYPGDAQLFMSDGSTLFDPSRFVVTLHDGRQLRVNDQTGLEQVTDINGNVLEIKPQGLFHSSGQSVTFARDPQGRITAITDPSGHTLSYAYDGNGDLLSYTDAVGNATQYAYDGSHYLLSILDPRGIQPIRSEYDASGRLLSHVDAFGNTIGYDHQISARTEVVTDRLRHSTTYLYDDDGNVLQATDPLGHVTKYTYDERDNKLTETNALRQTTSYTYDALDDKTSETDPLGAVTSYTYDNDGHLLSTTDPLGRVTQNTYDGSGNLTKTVDAAGNVTTHEYSS
ncbi:MAG TPA: kelch repeat-containing protein [Polyangiaceae bacterium]|nr:kelch repeat-containing protein [Polyangiaceae bacterium]